MTFVKLEEMKITDSAAIAFKWLLLSIAGLGFIFAYTSWAYEWPVEHVGGLGLGAIMVSIGGGIGMALHMKQSMMKKLIRENPDCTSMQTNGYHNAKPDYTDIKIIKDGHMVHYKCTTCTYSYFMIYRNGYYPYSETDQTKIAKLE